MLLPPDSPILEVETACQLESIKEDKGELCGMNCLKWDKMPLPNACVSNSGMTLKGLGREMCEGISLWCT